MIKLINILKEMLTEVSVEQLKTQFVDSNKISQKDFDEITNTTSKTAYITWLAKKVADKIITPIEIHKFKKYFDVFDRRKKEYPFADINQYKKWGDLNRFTKKSIEIANKESEDVSQQKGVSRKNKYKEFYIGSVDGFDVYELPQGRKDLYGVSCEIGSVRWCTADDRERKDFDRWISIGPLFIFIKSNEKYQFSYEGAGFKDYNDENINKKDIPNLFKFIEDYNPKYRVPLELKILNDNPESITYKDLNVIDNLDLSRSDVKSLPDGLKISGNLWLDNSYIESLPDDLKVKGSLSLNNCKYIESLPDDLKINGWLDLKNTKIKMLPLGLEVNNVIEADNSEITIILKDIKVKGNVYLKNTPISKKYTEAQLKQMCPGIEGEIIF